MAMAGQAAVCAGWLAFDGGDQSGARALYSEAFLLADQTDDHRLAIQALEKLALQSAFIADRTSRRGAAREAVRISGRVGALVRRESSPRLHALVAARQAISHAVAGDEPEFSRAIARSWRELDNAGALEAEESWLHFFDTGELRAQEAKGYRYLGKPEAAIRLYRASMNDPGASTRNRACYHAQLASSLSALGDNKSAISEGDAAITILEKVVSSPRSVAELMPVRQVAEAQGNREFCARYDQIAVSGSDGSFIEASADVST